MRDRLLLLLLLLSAPASAQEPHLAERDGLRILHAWTPATDGPAASVYLEVENDGTTPQTLTGGTTPAAASVVLAGFGYANGEETWTPLPGVAIAPGTHLTLAPNLLALRLEGLTGPLVEGTDLDLDVRFGEVSLPVAVEIGAPDATAHSHAGHSH